MSSIRPFRAWRPQVDLAPSIASPPYDVMSSSEARETARGNDLSFLHVIKPEIDLEPGIDPYDPRVYEKGAENLRRLIQRGALIREETPCFYIYQQRMGNHVQAGVVAGASVDEYEQGLIKKHEFTRPDKEDDRTRHVNALDANTGPVFLTYHASNEVDGIVDAIRAGQPEYDFVSDDGIGHTLWVVRKSEEIERLTRTFEKVSPLYIADGHHRSASATRVRAMRRDDNQAHQGTEEYNFFLAVIFPHDQMKIMAYNRVVKDLNAREPEDFLAALTEVFEVSPATAPEPDRPKCFGMFLGARWHRLAARAGSYPARDPVAALDCAILQDNLLHPVLGIEDPRTDKRIDFVGGIRGTDELERRCGGDWAVAFALYPTSIEQLISVADAGKVMPPKSTWFEPKLRSGLIVRPLED
ncbi:MAG: DUF1015 domain-containing protein [Candidatus Eisenbacteria sp.]|nr:DUF1015 domain-containing protein [Candidatus Eisenbacteria bacterium]